MEQPFALHRRAVLPAALGLLVPLTSRAGTPAGTGQDDVQPSLVGEGIGAALAQLDRVVHDAMQRTGIPGLAIAVVHQDRVVYLKGFGVRQEGKQDPVDPDTLFPLASVSKPIASTVVAAVVGDGVVAWDDPVVSHDPGFQMYDPWVTRQVTLRDMFAHRSGLPDHAGDLLEDIGYDRAAILYRLRYQKPDSSFRSHYAYTNFGLTEAAMATAKASGKSWEDLSAERLYRPLGMQRTSSRFADFAKDANRTHAHVRVGDGWIAKYQREPDAQSPAGGVTSSARDVAAWMRLQLGRGRLGDNEIIKQDALDETHRPQIVRVPPKNPMVDHAGFYGLGWNVDYDDRGRVHLSHSGAFDLGAATYVGLLPAEQLGIVALTNAQPIGVAEAIGRSFFDLVLTGKIEKDWVALYGQLMATILAPNYGTAVDYSKPPASASPASPASAYLGTYRNELYGNIAIKAGENGMVLRLGPAQTAFPLRHFDRDVFSYQPAGENAAGYSAVTFTVGADRLANMVTIENLDIDGQGGFQRLASK